MPSEQIADWAINDKAAWILAPKNNRVEGIQKVSIGSLFLVMG